MTTELENEKVKELVRLCIEGNLEARKKFQELLGAMIYNYVRVFFRSEKEEAADFYLYVFEKDRIFRRLEGFRGESITLENYLRYFVLKNLCLEWLRQKKHRAVDTVPYDDSEEIGSEYPKMKDGEQVLIDQEQDHARQVLSTLDKREFLILKLLCLEHYEQIVGELGAEDIRLIADESNRSIGDTVLLLNEIRECSAYRSPEHEKGEDDLNRIFMKSLAHQKRIAEYESEIEQLDGCQHRAMNELRARKAESERMLAWRESQREKHLEDIAKKTVTTPYKDLGRLMNWSPGNVSSRVARARKAFQSAYASIHNSGPR
jgi:RNA polymerase sigma factor (sigma-70 family)